MAQPSRIPQPVSHDITEALINARARSIRRHIYDTASPVPLTSRFSSLRKTANFTSLRTTRSFTSIRMPGDWRSLLLSADTEPNRPTDKGCILKRYKEWLYSAELISDCPIPNLPSDWCLLSWRHIRQIHAMARIMVFATESDLGGWAQETIRKLGRSWNPRVLAISLMHVLKPLCRHTAKQLNSRVSPTKILDGVGKGFRKVFLATAQMESFRAMADLEHDWEDELQILTVFACFVPRAIEALGFVKEGALPGTWADRFYRRPMYHVSLTVGADHREMGAVSAALYHQGMNRIWDH